MVGAKRFTCGVVQQLLINIVYSTPKNHIYKYVYEHHKSVETEKSSRQICCFINIYCNIKQITHKRDIHHRPTVDHLDDLEAW